MADTHIQYTPTQSAVVSLLEVKFDRAKHFRAKEQCPFMDQKQKKTHLIFGHHEKHRV
jgi:hypothetical protein